MSVSMLHPKFDVLRIIGACMEVEHANRGFQVIGHLYQDVQRQFHVMHQVGQLSRTW